MMRIGQSTDIHRLVEGRPLILGGVEIPYEKGTLGHSDGDALIHAITEAIIGALGKGDLGAWFPDNKESTEGVYSVEFLHHIVEVMKYEGYRLGNLDSLILIEKPKMAPYIQPMRELISNAIGCDVSRVNMKATTAEGLGEIGAGNAVLCQAVVLLEHHGEDVD